MTVIDTVTTIPCPRHPAEDDLIECDVLVDTGTLTLAVLRYPTGDLYEATWNAEAGLEDFAAMIAVLPTERECRTLAPHNGELGEGYRLTWWKATRASNN